MAITSSNFSLSSEMLFELRNVTIDELKQRLPTEINTNDVKIKLYKEIGELIKKLEVKVHLEQLTRKTFEENFKTIEEQKDIYNQFFKVQELLQDYLNQSLYLSLIYQDSSGKRHVVLAPHDATLLGKDSSQPWRKDLVYQMPEINVSNKELYQVLLASQEYLEKYEPILSQTASEAEKRWRQKKIRKGKNYIKAVWWNINSQLGGYAVPTRGPINEAYMNFYIHEAKLKGSLEQNLQTFALDKDYGMIKAINEQGLIVGDSSYDKIQFADKGEGAGPESIIQAVFFLNKLRNKILNSDDRIVKDFIETQRKIWEDSASSQIRELTGEELQQLLPKTPKKS